MISAKVHGIPELKAALAGIVPKLRRWLGTSVRPKLKEVLVDLAEGPRMMGRVDGIPNDAVRIGMSVRARVGQGAGGEPCVVFDPLDPDVSTDREGSAR